MLDIDVAGSPLSPRAASRSSGARRDHVRAAREHARLGTLVGADDKFTAHNAAEWKHGLLVRVPKGVELEQPLYVRVASAAEEGALFWRLPRRRGRGLELLVIEEYASGSPDLRAYSNAAVELFVEQGAKLEYVSLRTSPERRGTSPRTTRGRARRGARLGRRRLRLEEGEDSASRTTWPARCDLARDRRLLRRRRSTWTTTPFRSTSPRTRPPTSPSRAPPRQATTVWRGMIRVERDAQKTNAYQENRNLLLSRTRTPTRSPAWRSSRTTSAAPTARRSARSIAISSST
jgi:Fe-S cluster assembly protein SufD